MNKHFMMVAWVWFAGNVIGAIMSGSYIGGTQRTILDYLTVFTVSHFGSFPVLIPNWYFFDGMLSLMKPENYVFLNGNPLIIIIYLLNIALTVGMLVLFSAIVSSFFRRA